MVSSKATMKFDKRVFSILHDYASDSELIRHSRHACAITLKNNILGVGMARYKTHPLMAKYQDKSERVFLHAEIDAVVRVINRYGSAILKDCDMYILRLTKGGSLGMSKPCDGCQKAIDAFGIKNVYWSKS